MSFVDTVDTILIHGFFKIVFLKLWLSAFQKSSSFLIVYEVSTAPALAHTNKMFISFYVFLIYIRIHNGGYSRSIYKVELLEYLSKLLYTLMMQDIGH